MALDLEGALWDFSEMDTTTRYFDTHAHLDGFEAEGSTEAVLRRAAAASVVRICAIGGSPAANALAVRLAGCHPGLLVAAVGMDRDQAGAEHDWPALEALASLPGVAAIGETGLDYYYSPDSAPEQRALFGRMLEMALTCHRPVVVHSRYANADTLAMLREFSTAWKTFFHSVEKSQKSFPYRGKSPPPPGILHCFTGDAAFAEQLLDLGFMISFSGIVTFNNAGPLRETAKEIPEDRLLIETDCPYLTPKPFRGKVNEPAYVVRVADVLAEVRGTTPEDVAAATFRNANEVYRLEN